MRPREQGRDEQVGGNLAKQLSHVVEQEAHRLLTADQLAPDPARVSAGWERRFITDSARAEEALALYRELGYEVCADPVVPQELAEACSDCWLATQLRFVTIYTRRSKRAPKSERVGRSS